VSIDTVIVPTPMQVAAYRKSGIRKVKSDASRGRFGQKTAEKIQAQARQSVGITFLTDTVHLEMCCLLA
jgi:hypothetical protein